MLTLINAEIKNDQYNGYITLNIRPLSETINADMLVVMKKEFGSSSWRNVYEKEIEVASDLNLDLADMLTISNKKYTYSIDLKNGNAIVESQTFSEVKCEFKGLFVGNNDKQFVAGLDATTEAKLNTQVEYVTTLKGRIPYRVSNAETCYWTGSSSGLFLELTLDKTKFLPDSNHAYSTQVVDFLMDGTDKLLKTQDGQIWYVSIDSTASVPFNDHYIGMNRIDFSWTEIGDLPLAWVVEK